MMADLGSDCLHCGGVRLVGWSGAGPILCPTCSNGKDVFTVVTQAWREQRSKVRELSSQLAAAKSELAILKGPEAKWYSYWHEDQSGYELHDTAEEARAAALDSIQAYRDEADERGEWSDAVEYVEWGLMVPRERAEAVPHDDEPDAYDYRLVSVLDALVGDPSPTGPVYSLLEGHSVSERGTLTNGDGGILQARNVWTLADLQRAEALAVGEQCKLDGDEVWIRREE